MKKILWLSVAVISIQSLAQTQTPTPTSANTDEVTSLKAEIAAIKALLPSQSHAMTDVDYQFTNLWFAGKAANWPLAAFYLKETLSHLNWAARIRPTRKIPGGELDLKAMLQGFDAGAIAGIQTAIDKKNVAAFSEAYKIATNHCTACHVAADKAYLQVQIPAQPASRIISMKPLAK